MTKMDQSLIKWLRSITHEEFFELIKVKESQRIYDEICMEFTYLKHTKSVNFKAAFGSLFHSIPTTGQNNIIKRYAELYLA